MNDPDRFKLLFGPYKTPRGRVGAWVRCDVRGEVRVCGLSEARIPWPVARRRREVAPRPAPQGRG